MPGRRKKLRQAPAKRVFISHQGIQEGRKPEEERLQAMKEKYHDGMVTEAEQPSFAFLLNAATLKLVKKECMEGTG